MIDIKKHKFAIHILSGIVACLFIVLIISQIVGVVNRVKEGRYIGADVAYKNTISISGQGKVYTKPDIAEMNLFVVTQGVSVSDVQDENTDKMNDVVSFLKDFGIEDKNIKTIAYRIYPRYNYEDRKIPEIVGYEITQTLEIKVKEMDSIGDILDQAVDHGINQVSSLRFSVEDDEEFKMQAKALAIADAKEKAEELAKELGVKLIKISGYSEGASYDYRVYSEAGIGGGSPEIPTGENEISANIVLIYEID